MKNPDHITESLKKNFRVKILKLGVFRIQDGKNSDPGWKKF
jgi:hypothetical protein